MVSGFLSNMLDPLSRYYGVSEFTIQFTTSFYLLGSAIASITVGLITKEYGRVNIIKIVYFAILFFYFLIVAIQSLALLGIALLIIGFSVSIGNLILLNALMESIPVGNRSITLLAVTIAVLIGQVLNGLSILIISPNFEFYQTQNTLLANWVIIFLCSLSIIFLVRDSPRNLSILGKTEEAVQSLCEMISPTRLIVSKKAKAKLIREFISRENSLVERDYSALFSNNFKLMSVKQTFIYFFAFAHLYGSTAITVPLLRVNGDLSDYEVNKYLIYTLLVGIGVNFLLSILTNLKEVGFIIMTYVGYAIVLVLTLLMLFSQSSINIVILFIGGIRLNSLNTIVTYSKLVYPTVIRDISSGYLLFMGKIGGFAFQIVFGRLNGMNYKYPLWLSIGIILIGVILPVAFLKHEVNMIPLDDESMVESRSSSDDQESEGDDEKLKISVKSDS